MLRTKVLKTLESMPEQFELEEFIEKLVVIEQIETGLKDEATGNTIVMEDVQEYFEKKWAY